MSKILMISPEKCIGCRTCELICSFNKEQEFNPKNSAVSVIIYNEAAISVPMMCMHCEDPACMKVCSVSAISKDKDGNILIDRDKCIGCKLCVSACPFGNISVHTETKKVIKCDLCGGKPKCAEWCPTGAIEYKDGSSINLTKKKQIAERFKEVFGEVPK